MPLFRKKGRYDGPVMFALDGFHYPIDKDGNKKGSQPVVWVSDEPDNPESNAGHYEWGSPSSPTHFGAFGLNPIELEVNPQ